MKRRNIFLLAVVLLTACTNKQIVYQLNIDEIIQSDVEDFINKYNPKDINLLGDTISGKNLDQVIKFCLRAEAFHFVTTNARYIFLHNFPNVYLLDYHQYDLSYNKIDWMNDQKLIKTHYIQKKKIDIPIKYWFFSEEQIIRKYLVIESEKYNEDIHCTITYYEFNDKTVETYEQQIALAGLLSLRKNYLLSDNAGQLLLVRYSR